MNLPQSHLQESISLPPVAGLGHPAPSSGCGTKWPTGVQLRARFAPLRWSYTSAQPAKPGGQTTPHDLTPQPTKWVGVMTFTSNRTNFHTVTSKGHSISQLYHLHSLAPSSTNTALNFAVYLCNAATCLQPVVTGHIYNWL